MFSRIVILALVGCAAANPGLWAVNPNALNVPLDEPITALAKNAQLIQQNTEGTRNILGGGIPLALPADTPEVAAGKQAHAIAHANQVAATAGHGLIATPAVAAVSPVLATRAIATPWAATPAIATSWASTHAIATPWAARTIATPWAAAPLAHSSVLLGRKRRSLAIVNPNALNVPLDEPITAWAKNAQLIQQNTEGTRNILGGGIPLALPADTPEVAAGKQAHAIAHANQVAATSGHGLIATPAVAAVSPVLATRAISTPWAAAPAIATSWASTHAIATPWAARTIATPWAAAPLAHSSVLLGRKRRSLAIVNPNALNVPLDEPITAWAKNAQLIQQNTEGTRNILGGGIPLALPADTPEVAAGKQAHAIAHANQVAATTGHGLIATPAVAAVSPILATRAITTPWAAPWTAAPLGLAGPLGLARTHWW